MRTSLIVLIILLTAQYALPQETQYILDLENDSLTGNTIYEFDIYIQRQGAMSFELASLSPVLYYNTAISGGTLTFTINPGSSELNESQKPTNAQLSIIGNELRIAANPLPGPGSGTTIPPAPGLRVGRFRLTSSIPFEDATPDITWKNETAPFTTVYAYILSVSTNITIPASHIISLSNNSLSPINILNTSPLPSATAGISYNDTLLATGGFPPYTWSVSNGILPTGITLSSNGIITGISTAAGVYSFTAKATDDNTTYGTKSFGLTLNPSSVAKLVFIQQPTNTIAGKIIDPAITVQTEDIYGNITPSAGIPVTLTLIGTGILSGTLSRNTDADGLASFNDISINSTGIKSLIAASDGLVPDTSDQFSLTSYIITATAGPNGSIAPSGSVPVNYGASQSFTITPGTDYHVDSVFVDGAFIGAVTNYTFTNVTSNHTINAKFAINTFTITATAGPNGSIAPSGSVPVNYGASQSFTITPGTGYHVDSVFVDGAFIGAVTNYTFTNVTSNHTINAKFAINTFTITATAGPNGSIAPSGSVPVNYGASQSFTITPGTGYHVDSVFVDGAFIGAVTNYTFTNVISNHTINAKFAINTFTITATAGSNGSIAPSGSVPVNYGASQSFTITPGTGYHVDSVFVDGAYIGAVTNYTFTNITSNHTINAKFAINQYKITASAGVHGTIVPSGDTLVAHGTTITFKIRPNAGYQVDSLKVDGIYIGRDTVYSFVNVTANHTISASFELDTITITIQTIPENLSIIIDGVPYLSPVTFQWIATDIHTISTDSIQNTDLGERYVWKSWNDGGRRSHSVAPLENTTYTALFGVQYYLTMVANPGGSAIPPSGWQDSGAVVTITAVPNGGYMFVNWSGSGNGVGEYSGSANPAQVTMDAPITQTANFVREPVQIYIQTIPPGRYFYYDGIPYNTPQTRTVIPGEMHDLNVNSPQDGGAGIRYVWQNWSDDGEQSHSIVPESSTTYTAYFTTQYTLSIGAKPDIGGTVAPQSGWQDSGKVVNISASSNIGYSFLEWNGSGAGSYTGSNALASVTMNSPITDTALFTQFGIQVSVTANPPGRSFSVDGVEYDSTQQFTWIQGSSHTIATTPIQISDSVTRYLFQNWSDDGSISHTVSPLSDTIFTADFSTQYYLTMIQGSGGTVSPASDWYDKGETVTITAVPNSAYSFGGWNGTGSGSYTGTDNPASIRMDSPIVETASFAIIPIRITFTTNPDGISYTVDETHYDTTQTFTWNLGSTHTIGTISPQSGSTGIQYIWQSWSDGGAQNHTIAPESDTQFTVNFKTQFYLNMIHDTNESVLPGSSWHDSGNVVPISAAGKAGYQFSGWTGSGTGSYTGPNNPADVTMHSPISEEATFSRFPAQVTIFTNPPNLGILVDDTAYTSPHTFYWTTGSSHSIAVPDTQPGTTGVRYLWKNWSDNKAIVHNVIVLNDTIYTAYFSNQYFLTMIANPGGSVAPPSGWFNSGQVVAISADPDEKYTFNGWAGIGAGSVTGMDNPSTVTMNAPITETASFARKPIQIVIQAEPAGRYFIYDGQSYNTPQTRILSPGEQHFLNIVSPQAISPGSQYVWTNWSDGGQAYHLIFPDSSTTYTAYFSLEHLLTIDIEPPGSGTTTQPSEGFHQNGDTISIEAMPNYGYAFSGWSGDTISTLNPIRVPMDEPKYITANFAQAVQVTLNSVPSGREITVDDSAYITPLTLGWIPGTYHSIGTNAVQSGAVGIQYVWRNWSDSGAISHIVAPSSDTTFTAVFNTQFYLTMNAAGGGRVEPASGWRDQNETIFIRAIPEDNFVFFEWSGTGDGSYSGIIDTATIYMRSPITQSAAFGHILPPPVLIGIQDDSTGVETSPTLLWSSYSGATRYYVQVSTDSLFINSGNIILNTYVLPPQTSVQLIDLANHKIYYWRVRARVGADITQFSDVWKFETVNAVINVISSFTTLATSFTYQVQWWSEDLSGSINLRISTDSGSSFSLIKSNVENTGSAYWKIPDVQNYISDNCILRIESYLNEDIYGETDTFRITGGDLPSTVPLSVSIPFPADPKVSTEYKLFSVPGVADTLRAGDLFTGTSKVDWRMFTDNGTADNFLVELTSASQLRTGWGYWFIRKGNLDLPSYTMVMPPLDSVGATANIQLHEGWNIIGNPFDIIVSWETILRSNRLPSFTPLYAYSESYVASSMLEPFRGYYYFNEENLSILKIPYPFETVKLFTSEPKVSWRIQLVFESDINRDQENYLGIAEDSKQDKDIWDNYKPPLFRDQGFLYFQRPEWNNKFSRFSSDFRPSIGDGQIWKFEVSNPRKTTGTLNIKGIDRIAKELDVVLINELNSTPVDLRKKQEYTFDMVSQVMPFRIIIGTKEFVNRHIESLTPQKYELEQNFPNPFNSSTSITVRLPVDAQIRLEIYSVLGQRVKTLIDARYSPGVHTFRWDGTDNSGNKVPTGIYFYRLTESGKPLNTKKMIVLQ